MVRYMGVAPSGGMEQELQRRTGVIQAQTQQAAQAHVKKHAKGFEARVRAEEQQLSAGRERDIRAKNIRLESKLKNFRRKKLEIAKLKGQLADVKGDAQYQRKQTEIDRLQNLNKMAFNAMTKDRADIEALKAKSTVLEQQLAQKKDYTPRKAAKPTPQLTRSKGPGIDIAATIPTAPTGSPRGPARPPKGGGGGEDFSEEEEGELKSEDEPLVGAQASESVLAVDTPPISDAPNEDDADKQISTGHSQVKSDGSVSHNYSVPEARRRQAELGINDTGPTVYDEHADDVSKSFEREQYDPKLPSRSGSLAYSIPPQPRRRRTRGEPRERARFKKFDELIRKQQLEPNERHQLKRLGDDLLQLDQQRQHLFNVWKAELGELDAPAGWSKRGGGGSRSGSSSGARGSEAGGFGLGGTGDLGGLGGYSGGFGDPSDAGKLGPRPDDPSDGGGGGGGGEADVARRIEGRQVKMEDMMKQLLRRPKDDKRTGKDGKDGKASIMNILAHVTTTPKRRVKKTGRRIKAVRDAKKQTIPAARKRYTALKKDILKALRVGKKRAYDSQNTKIKQMSPKQRKAARAKVRAELKQRLDRLLKDIKPASFYKRVDMIEGAIQVLRKLKW